MKRCSVCQRTMEISYMVMGTGFLVRKLYEVTKYFDSLEQAEDFYDMVASCQKTITWDLFELYHCENELCKNFEKYILKTTHEDKRENKKGVKK